MTIAGGPTERVEVLVVDDDPDVAELVATFLKRTDAELAVRTATGPEAGLEAVRSEDVDWVVSDHHMPGTKGLTFLERVADVAPEVGRILHSSDDRPELRRAARESEVTFVHKRLSSEQYERLVEAICRRPEVEAAD